MANRSFYVDEIYRNENDDFYTGLALEHNEWLKDRYKFEKVADPYTTCKGKTVRCEYSQIFYPDSQMLLCNDIASVDGNLYDNLESGELSRYYDADGNEVDADDDWENEEPIEIYQYYLIDRATAERLKEHTDEIIFYCEMLDLCVLGVTHWGTGWDYVEADFVY